MKKLLLSMMLIVATMVSASAAKIVMAEIEPFKDLTATADITAPVTADGFTFTFAKNSGTTAPAYNLAGKDVRLYAKGTVTITSSTPITKMIFVISNQGRKRLAPITASTGAIAAQTVCEANDPNPVYVTWTGNATEVTLTVGDKADFGTEGSSKAGQFDFSEVYMNQEVDAEPTIDPASLEGVANIAAWLAKADSENLVRIDNPVTVVYQNAANLYVQDATGSLLIYGTVGKTYNNGDVLPAGIAGKYAPYQGLPEMGDVLVETFKDATAGSPIAPTVVTIPDFPASSYSKYVEIQNVTVAAEGTYNTYTITDAAGNSMQMYNTFKMATINVGSGVTVRGFVAVHSGTPQLAVSWLSNSGENPDPGTDGVANIAAWLAKADTENNVAITNPVSVVYQNGSRLYVKDSTGWLLIYGNVKKTYTNGQLIPGGFAGKYAEFRGAPQMSADASTFANGIAGTPVEPTFVTIEDLNSEPINSFVELEAINITNVTGTSGKDATLEDVDGNTFPAYNQFSLENFVESENMTIRGFVTMNNTARQFIPTEILSASEAGECAAPVFTPGAGTVKAGTEVTIATSTIGADIYYTTDGSTPSTASTKYTSAIAINEDVTIKAIAVKAGLTDSEVVTAEYKIEAPIVGGAETWFIAPEYTEGPANAVKLVNKDGSTSGNNAADQCLCGQEFAASDVTVKFGDGVYNEQYDSWNYSFAAGTAVRWYQNETLTLTPAEGQTLRKVEFKALNNYVGSFTPSTGSVETDGNTITWAGESTDAVVFTNTKQIRFSYFVVTTQNSGVEGIAADADVNAPVEFYNMQGVRVLNPENGLYIRVQGSKATKVLVK